MKYSLILLALAASISLSARGGAAETLIPRQTQALGNEL
jgi:hypothetical protein